MRHQASRTIALMLGVMLAAAPAAQAGTITYGELVQTAGAGGQLRTAIDIRLRLAAQGVATGQAGSAQSGAASSQEAQQPSGQQQQQTPAPNGSTNISAPASADPTLSQSGGKIETIDLGDVTGTVCDCGEIPVNPIQKAGAFPWWILGGIPLVCVSGICTGGGDDTPPNTPPGTPTPTPPQVPEPMSLLLFGSGLLAVGAGARRRRARKQLEGEAFGVTTEEV